MNSLVRFAMLPALAIASIASAQVERADFRIRAEFRLPNNAPWGARESIGNVDFRIQSRFMQVYYGGVHRSDEFKFNASFNFTDASDFATSFAGSIYDTDLDIYINNSFVGRLDMNSPEFGMGELTYDSRHPELPELPLPAAFPDPVNVGDIVRIFSAAATLPEIGDALPGISPLFTGELAEKFARGDVDQDGKVDMTDFATLASNYDPYHQLGQHIGPAAGDFSADNLSDFADYEVMAANWTDNNDDIPPPPAPVAPCAADFNADGTADFFDYLDFVNAFGDSLATSDFNHDGIADFFDYLDFVDEFSAGC